LNHTIKDMANQIKFSKVLGQVEILSQDENTTTVLVVKTGETKKLSNAYANLQDEPFVKAKKVKAPKVEWTEQMEEDYSAVYNDLRKLDRISAMNVKNGKYGASKFL